jgi:class 3 adenylate cyclase/tetratricopeptide (TPR) repeat protein
MIRCGSCGEENARSARFCSACAAPLGPSEAARESRRVVTILFADLVASTTIGERLDPEALRALQTRYFATLKDVIERHGGTVEKYIGDAVMAVFGLPLLHEDDALRAVRAAADLAPSLEGLHADLEARHGIHLDLRTGVHTGEVVAADSNDRQSMVSGDTVNTAARLEAAARPGEILLGPLTHDLVRDAITAETLDDLALRGRNEPVAAFRLLAITGTEAHIRRMDTPLVGRVGELRVLGAAFDRAVGGPACELVTVLAQAGTGKSRLVREFLATIGDRGTILRGRCLNYGDGITYWALGEILRAAGSVEETDDPAQVRAKLDALVAADRDAPRVAGILASVLGVSAEPASADDIAWAVRRTLILLARQRPLVVLVEDIHWAEPALLDLLEAIVDWSQGTPILLLCPARPELLESRADWGAGRPNAAVLNLEPLDASLASALIDVLPGGSVLPGDLRVRILETAEGNPLFVEEFLAMLVDEGHLHPDADGAWTAAASLDDVRVPTSISLLMAARLDSLDPGDRHVAERASVVGRVFERGAVTELSPEAERGSLGGRLLSLTRRQVIRPDAPGLDGDDAFRFRHVLIRDAAYEALTKAERADLHERFARWLEHVTGDRLAEYSEIYAYHLAQAVDYLFDLGNADVTRLAGQTIDALMAAADTSERLNAYPSVVRHCRRALAIAQRARVFGLEPTIDEIDTLRRAAEAAFLGGDTDLARDLGGSALHAAEVAHDASSECLIRASLAAYSWEDGDESAANQYAASAQSALTKDVPADVQAVVLASTGRFYMLQARCADAILVCREAIAIAADDGRAGSAKASALVTLATCLDSIDEVDEAEATFAEARRQAEACHDGFNLVRYYNNYSMLLDGQGRVAEQDALTREGIAATAALGLERSYGAVLTLNLARNAMWYGRPEEVLELSRLVADYRQFGDDAMGSRLGIGVAYIDLGRLAEARSAFKALRGPAMRFQPPDGRQPSEAVADLELLDALVDLWLGRPNDAARGFALALDYYPIHRRDERARAYMLLVRAAADVAVSARTTGDALALATALGQARAYAAAADSEAATGRLLDPGQWRRRDEFWMLHVGPELARAEGRADPEGWASVAETAAAHGFANGECYARWRQAQDLVSMGAPLADLERVVRRGIEVGYANVPARRELEALARGLGMAVEAATEAVVD